MSQIYTDVDAGQIARITRIWVRIGDNINMIKNKKKKFREEYEECSYNCERGNGQHHPAL